MTTISTAGGTREVDRQALGLAGRLGCLGVGERMAREAKAIAAFADEIRDSFERVVVCGAGASALAPAVLWRTFGRRDGYPQLVVLDSTDPRAIAAVSAGGDLRETLFVIASTSGTTRGTTSLYQYFWKRTGGQASQFVAITGPGTPLATLGGERRFRRTFLNPADPDGRCAVLSHFGLVPAALVGVNTGELLHRARSVAEASISPALPHENAAGWLGTMLGAAALSGTDKLTFVLSPGLSSFGAWAEQLLVGSTARDGKGIVPVVGEPLGTPEVYGSDRVFVAVTLAGEEDRDATARLDALGAAGHPVVRLAVRDRYDLGGELARWEFAAAVAGAVMHGTLLGGPNVAASEQETGRVLAERPALTRPASRETLDAFLAGIPRGHYLAILAYLQPSAEDERRLAAIRLALRDRLRVATTVGYGPRYLHSTGQLHKAGPPTGHFLQIVDPAADDIPVPGEPFTFGELKVAQAEGDLLALERCGRPVVRIEGMDLLEP